MPPDVPDFLQPLVTYIPVFQREACLAAIARREESVHHLIRSIEWAVENPEEAVAKDYMLHLYAVHLLAELREHKAYDSIVRMARSPSADDLLGDTVTNRLNSILAAVCGDKLDPIKEIVLDPDADEYARGAAVRAFGALTFESRLTREELAVLFSNLVETLPRDSGHHWDCIASTAAEFRLAEILPAIRKLYEEDLTDPSFWPLEDIETEIVKPFNPGDHTLEREFGPFTSAVEEMEWWAAFDPRENEPFIEEEAAVDDRAHGVPFHPIVPETIPATPIRREAPKAGRNDPCPCGSGKKFKKCCNGRG
jgi:hypothetical protein